MERSYRPIVLLAALLGLVALGFSIRGRGEDRPALGVATRVANLHEEARSTGTIQEPSSSEAAVEQRRSLASGRGEELPRGVPSAYNRGVPEPLPGAKVRLRLIDAATRAPIAGLGFEVYRERGGDRVLAAGESDEEGRAEIDDVEPNVVLFRTEYRPPYARTFEALWLDPGDERELTIEVVRGGRITGRLVDSDGRPVAGLQIVRQGQRGEIPISDAEGRFELEGVTSTPKGVWIKAGGMEPERYYEMRFNVVDPPYFVANFGAKPEPGETVDIGDVQVARRVRFRGRVIDEEGEPRAGVLVGMRSERTNILRFGQSSEEPFQFYEGAGGRVSVHDGECLTDASGSFEFSAVPARWGAGNYAIAPSGFVAWWEIPEEARKNEALTEIDVQDIVLPETPLYLFEFKAPDGQRLSVKRRTRDEARPTGSVHSSLFFGDVAVQFYDADGSAVSGKITQSPDLIARIGFAGDPAQVAGLRIFFPGYLPLFEHLEEVGVAQLRPERLRSYVLTPRLAIRGRLSVWDDRSGTGHEPATLRLSCEISPVVDDHPLSGSGLGSVLFRDLAQGRLDFELPVLSNEPFWILADSRGMKMEPNVFGPFLPGDEVHELELSFVEDEELDLRRSFDAHARPEFTEVPLGVFESDGEPGAEGTRIRCGLNWGSVEEDGRGVLRLFDSEAGPVVVQRSLEEGGTATQVIDSWRVDPVEGVEIQLQEWHTAEVVLRGLSAARRAVALSPRLHPTVFQGVEWYGDERGATGMRLPDLPDGAVRWRFLLGAGGWELRGGNVVTAGLTGGFDVLEKREQQVFEFWME